MRKTAIVSLKVSPEVSGPPRFQNAEIISAKWSGSRRQSAAPGLYLIRNGSSFMFQMRLPKSIASDIKRPLRIGLGVVPKKEARQIADRLAAIARQKFQEIEMAMASDDERGYWPLIQDMLGGDAGALSAEEASERAWLALQMYLKSTLYDIRNPPPKPTPEEERNFAMMRGLVRIGQEKARKDAGKPYNAAVGDNAEFLAKRLCEKFENEPVTDIPNTAKARGRKGGKINLTTGLALVRGQTEVEKDRRYVERRKSDKPLFSQAALEYLTRRRMKKLGANKDITTAETRLNLFIELIGDHPVDTYTPTDLQAFINLMAFWPPREKDRPPHLPAREIIDSNRDLSKGSMTKQTLRNGYLGVIKPVFSKAATFYDFDNPLEGAALDYPESARAPISAEPLSTKKIETLFRTGRESPYIDEVMLPLLGYLTGRRLGLLIHLMGSDIREKFDGVWVAEAGGIVQVNGIWKRRPIKTEESGRYFVLHNFLVEIGYVEWAREQGEKFLFPQLMGLADPSKSASQYMRRLFDRAKIKGAPGERFHSLRGDYITDTRENQAVRGRARRMQVGHALGDDEHDKYGWKTLTEFEARTLANAPLQPEIDFSMFSGLDFDRLARARRTRGRTR